MKLYYLHVEIEPGVKSKSRTLFVLADSLFGAISAVPDGVSVKAVEVQVGNAVEPRCVIKAVSGPVVH
jgi:hypothetical protein